jgi:hypothetical protein
MGGLPPVRFWASSAGYRTCGSLTYGSFAIIGALATRFETPLVIHRAAFGSFGTT